MTVCPGAQALAGETYFVDFRLRNPALGQTSPSISMEAMAVDAKTLDDGSYLPPVNIPLITVDKPDQALLGVATRILQRSLRASLSAFALGLKPSLGRRIWSISPCVIQG